MLLGVVFAAWDSVAARESREAGLERRYSMEVRLLFLFSTPPRAPPSVLLGYGEGSSNPPSRK